MKNSCALPPKQLIIKLFRRSHGPSSTYLSKGRIYGYKETREESSEEVREEIGQGREVPRRRRRRRLNRSTIASQQHITQRGGRHGLSPFYFRGN